MILCDALCGLGPSGMVFAKKTRSPDRRGRLGRAVRSAGVRWAARCARSTSPSGTRAPTPPCCWCPTWLWGAEHGVNEFGVAIGNGEGVSTVHRVAGGPARPDGDGSGAPRPRTGSQHRRSRRHHDRPAHHPRAGGDSDAVRQEAYDSSFLIADAGQAFVLDTSGTSFAAAPFPDGTAISNRITLGSNWTKGSTDLLSR